MVLNCFYYCLHPLIDDVQLQSWVGLFKEIPVLSLEIKDVFKYIIKKESNNDFQSKITRMADKNTNIFMQLDAIINQDILSLALAEILIEHRRQETEVNINEDNKIFDKSQLFSEIKLSLSDKEIEFISIACSMFSMISSHSCVCLIDNLGYLDKSWLVCTYDFV